MGIQFLLCSFRTVIIILGVQTDCFLKRRTQARACQMLASFSPIVPSQRSTIQTEAHLFTNTYNAGTPRIKCGCTPCLSRCQPHSLRDRHIHRPDYASTPWVLSCSCSARRRRQHVGKMANRLQGNPIRRNKEMGLGSNMGVCESSGVPWVKLVNSRLEIVSKTSH